MKKIYLLPLLTTLAFSINPVFGEETFRVNWAGSSWSGDPALIKYIPQKVIILTGQKGITLVDEKSQPPSPFDNKAAALQIQSTPEDSFWFRLLFRPFEAEKVSSGLVEFNIRPAEGGVMIQGGCQPLPWNPESAESYKIDPKLGSFGLSLIPGEEPNLRGIKVETNSISVISSNTNYRVTIKWNLTQEQRTIHVFLNGEALRNKGWPDPLNAHNSKNILNSINVFRIFLGSSESKTGKLYLGPITAATGPNPVMDKADDPLLPK